ncbi:MAG: hypothetical protein PHI85_11170, partial [Victivallaceae bacterium]|nr:hypothetical protein [Victivallaceae bacterium]
LGPVVISAITTVSLFLSNRQCFFTPSGCSRLAFPAAAAAQFKSKKVTFILMLFQCHSALTNH